MGYAKCLACGEEIIKESTHCSFCGVEQTRNTINLGLFKRRAEPKPKSTASGTVIVNLNDPHPASGIRRITGSGNIDYSYIPIPAVRKKTLFITAVKATKFEDGDVVIFPEDSSEFDVIVIKGLGDLV